MLSEKMELVVYLIDLSKWKTESKGILQSIFQGVEGLNSV